MAVRSASDCKHNSYTSSRASRPSNLGSPPRNTEPAVCSNPDNGAPERHKLFTTPSAWAITTNTKTRLVREGFQIPTSEATVNPLAQEISEPDSFSELGATHGGYQTWQKLHLESHEEWRRMRERLYPSAFEGLSVLERQPGDPLERNQRKFTGQR